MPQMSPMLWLVLMVFFLASFLLFSIFLYYKSNLLFESHTFSNNKEFKILF